MEDHTEAIQVVARSAGVHHLHRAAGETESHRPEAPGARPVDEIVDAGGEEAALRKAFHVFRR